MSAGSVALYPASGSTPTPQSPLPAPPPAISFGSKVVNLYSLAFLALCLGTVVVFWPLLMLAYARDMLFNRKRRRTVDAVVGAWSKAVMLLFFWSKPTVHGLENLPAAGTPALLTPNHCSFLDIFTLSGFLGRPLKYVSKIEILRIPLIGWAMQMAGHIALRRSDRKSQLATFRDSVRCLENGNHLVRRSWLCDWAMRVPRALRPPFCWTAGYLPRGHEKRGRRARSLQSGPLQNGVCRWCPSRPRVRGKHSLVHAHISAPTYPTRREH